MPAYDKADLERRMHGAVEALKHDLGGLRTGRASTTLLDPVKVEVYGANMPLNQVATVSAPEPRMLSVQVWDRSNVGPVEKAIRNAGLGLNPIVDGQNIRLPIPDLTEERRKELAKLAHQYAEKAQDRGPQRPPRRHGRAQDRREEEGDQRGRAQAPRHRGPEADRRDDRGDRRRCSRAKEKEILQQVSAEPAKRRGRTARRRRAVPRHVAIIMDGNGRWAKARGLPRAAGHRAGAEAARKVLRAAGEAGVECLTLYAFSSENWRRPAQRDQRPDGPAALLHPARARQPAQARASGSRSSAITTPSRPMLRRWSTRRWRRPPAISRMTLAIALNYGARGRARPRRAQARGGASRPSDRRGAIEARARHRRPAAARPADPHLGRASAVQLPALAGGLCRIAVRRHALARFRRRRAARRARRLRRRERRYGGL